MVERVVSPELWHAEHTLDKALRPTSLDDYIGQTTVCQQLRVFMDAAKARGEALDHVLIFGPPGLGKTTLARIIAQDMGVQLKTASGPVLDKAGDVAAVLTQLGAHDVFFLDEIHRLNASLEELLYPAMEDYQIDIVIGEGPGARSLKLDIKPFTLVGATTRAGMLTSPLRDRFGIVLRLAFYTVQELMHIINRAARLLSLSLEPEAAEDIAKRSRGTPRIAHRLLRRVRDVAQVRGVDRVSCDLADEALTLLDVDRCGLDVLDRKLLSTILKSFRGGPVGLDSLAATLSEDKHTLEDVVEPYLIQAGYIVRTARGRVATEAAYRHFGLPYSDTEGQA